MSQIIAGIGAIAGGALPVLDFLFAANLQTALATELASAVPTLAESIDISSLLTSIQIFIFFGFLGIASLLWFTQARAKEAPSRTTPVLLPS